MKIHEVADQARVFAGQVRAGLKTLDDAVRGAQQQHEQVKLSGAQRVTEHRDQTARESRRAQAAFDAETAEGAAALRTSPEARSFEAARQAQLKAQQVYRKEELALGEARKRLAVKSPLKRAYETFFDEDDRLRTHPLSTLRTTLRAEYEYTVMRRRSSAAYTFGSAGGPGSNDALFPYATELHRWFMKKYGPHYTGRWVTNTAPEFLQSGVLAYELVLVILSREGEVREQLRAEWEAPQEEVRLSVAGLEVARTSQEWMNAEVERARQAHDLAKTVADQRRSEATSRFEQAQQASVAARQHDLERLTQVMADEAHRAEQAVEAVRATHQRAAQALGNLVADVETTVARCTAQRRRITPNGGMS